MASSKRKLPKGKVKLSREESLQLQYAKRAGLISNRTKLDRGVVTKSAQRKLDTLRTLDAVPRYEAREGSRKTTRSEPRNKPVKLTKDQRSRYREHGYPVFNGFAVTDDPREARELLAQNKLVSAMPAPIRGNPPVKVISLGRIRTFRDLKLAAEDGRLDALKRPEDIFSFTLNDFHPKPSRIIKATGERAGPNFHPDFGSFTREFYSAAELMAYLDRYDFMNDDAEDDEDAFRMFELYRMPEGYDFGPTPERTYARKKASGELHERKRQRKSRAKANKQERTRMSDTEYLDRNRDSQERSRASETQAENAARLAKQRIINKRRNRRKSK